MLFLLVQPYFSICYLHMLICYLHVHFLLYSYTFTRSSDSLNLHIQICGYLLLIRYLERIMSILRNLEFSLSDYRYSFLTFISVDSVFFIYITFSCHSISYSYDIMCGHCSKVKRAEVQSKPCRSICQCSSSEHVCGVNVLLRTTVCSKSYNGSYLQGEYAMEAFFVYVVLVLYKEKSSSLFKN